MENKDNLSGRQIISQRYQDLDASEQFTAFGSPTIKALAQSMPDSAPDALRSPMRLQHLFNGYFSTIGRYSLDASDAAMRATNKAPTAPASNSPIGTIGNNVFGSMLSKSSTDRRNNAEGTLDDNYSRLVKIGNTFNAMQKQGEVERMNRYYGQNADIMQYKPAIKDLYEQMSNAKKAEIDIYRDPDMSASDKRDALNEITKERDQMLRENAPLLQAVDSL